MVIHNFISPGGDQVSDWKCGSNPGGGGIFFLFAYLVVSLRVGYLKAAMQAQVAGRPLVPQKPPALQSSVRYLFCSTEMH